MAIVCEMEASASHKEDITKRFSEEGHQRRDQLNILKGEKLCKKCA